MGKTLTAKFKAVDEMSVALDKMASSGTKVCSSLDSVRNISTAVSQKVTSVETSISDAAAATYEWTDKLGTYNKDAMEAIYTNDELVEMGMKTKTVLEEAIAPTDELAEGLDELGDESRKTSEEIDKLGKQSQKTKEDVDDLGDKSKKTGQEMEDAFEAVGGLLATIGISAAIQTITTELIECSEAAMTFETSMATVSTIADTSKISLDEIASGVRNNAVNVATFSSDYTDAVYAAISASVDTANAVGFVSDATKLAIGGFTSATTSVDVLTTAVNAYGLEVSQASQISDYLVTTQNLGKTTVDELATSVGKVIPLASAYSVEMNNLSTTYAVMTANGIATAEATTYIKGMLSELGNTGSEVAKILQEETGSSFATLMARGNSLGDVLQILGDSVDGDTTAFSNLWSSQEAGVGALSLFNSGADKFNSVLLEMRDSAGATEAAFNIMAETTSFAKQQMEVAANSTKIAIGDFINPALKELYNIGTDVLTWTADIAAENPALVRGIISVTAGVGVLTVGITALTAATKLQAAAQTALNAIKMIDPIYLATAAVAALAAAIGTGLVLSMGEAEDSYYSLTTESKRNYDQLQETTAEYEKAVEVYGETSSEALSLKYQVDDLTQAYETNKQTVEEYHNSFMESIDALRENSEQRAKNIEEAEIEAGSIVYLSEKLEELISVQRKTTSEENEILNIVSSLNSAIPNLSLNYDTYTNSLNMTTDAVKAYAEAEAKKALYTTYQESYNQSYADAVKASHDLATATDAVVAAEIDLENARNSTRYKEYLSLLGEAEKNANDLGISEIALRIAYKDEIDAVNDASDALSIHKEEVDTARDAINSAMSELGSYTNAMKDVCDITLETSDSISDLSNVTDDMMLVINNTADSITNLCTAYNEAYVNAYESVSGQFNLWDEVDTKVSETTSSLTKSMQQQIDYWSDYNSNLEKLNENKNIDGLNEMLNSINDGSEEAAASLAAMAGASDTELKKMVDKYNELKKSQSDAASTMAETATDFDTKLSEIQNSMTETIDEMNLSAEASNAAKSTMDAYIQKIKDSKSSAVQAASDIAIAVSDALNGVNITPTTTDGSHALGLSYVPYDGYISELHKGEAVLTADEADVWRSATFTSSELGDSNSALRVDSTINSNKKITVEIAGSGTVSVSGGSMSHADVENIVRERLEPILVSILEQEIFEESEGNYEF